MKTRTWFPLLLAATGCAVDEADFSEIESELVGDAANSGNSATSNAVVYLTGPTHACTGTLVSPRVVLTAGHCLKGFEPGDDHAHKDGKWHPFRHDHFLMVHFGPDPTGAPVHPPIPAYYLSSPPAINMTTGSGHDDIALIGLDEAVPSSVAVPRAIVFESADISSSETVVSYGFGNDDARRTFGYANDWADQSRRSYLTANVYNATLQNGALGTFGDSGGPLMLGSTNGPVIGVHQGHSAPEGEDAGASIRGVKTFGRGEAGVKPDISAWLQAEYDRDGFEYRGWVVSSSATGGVAKSHNSVLGTNTVEHLSTGSYRVKLPGLAAGSDDNAQVTALGAGSERCKILAVTRTGPDANAFVYCHDANGALVNTRFVASYTGANHRKMRGVHFLADRSTSADYVPSTFYSSVSITANVVRHSTGLYRFTLRDQNTAGTAQVTAVGADSGYCKSSSVITNGNGNPEITVLCHDNAGNRADLRFYFHWEAGKHDPSSHGNLAYARAHQPDIDVYTTSFPSPRYSLGGGDIYMWRVAVGQYWSWFENLHTWAPSGSAAHVTASGPGNVYCKPSGWGTYNFGNAGTGVRITVSCFAPGGTPANGRYDVGYMTPTL